MTQLSTPTPEAPPTPSDPAASAKPEPAKLFAGKFDTIEAMEKSVPEADKKIAQQAERIKELEAQATSTPATPTATGQDPAQPLQITRPQPGNDAPTGIDEIIKKAGVDPNEAIRQWAQDGKLSDDYYTKLEGQKIGKDLANEFMVGKQATAQQAAGRAFEIAGGKEQFQELIGWAGQSLDDQTMANINAQLGNTNTLDGAVYQLMARRSAAGAAPAPATPGMVDSGNAPSVSSAIPTDIKGFDELNAKVSAKDTTAIKTLGRMTHEQIAHFG